MSRLKVEGTHGEGFERALTADRTVRLGRAPRVDRDADPSVEALAVPWDSQVSRNHAELRWDGHRLQVRRLPSGRNKIFHGGEEYDELWLEIGGHFVVGSTRFVLNGDPGELESESRSPVDVVSYTVEELKAAPYRDADTRLEVLADLPSLIRGADDDGELCGRLVDLLLAGVPAAEAAAVVELGDGAEGFELRSWRSRSGVSLRPSRRLILDALRHRRHSVRNLWADGGGDGAGGFDYTLCESLDWAFCTPVPGDACGGWGLYVAGCSARASVAPQAVDLRPDMRFAELVAQILGALRDTQRLQRHQSTLSRFFSPAALPVLIGAGAEEALRPRQTQLTVLFCDLRGFSRESERSKGDLLDLLRRVSRALDVMTDAIHEHRGVVADFQGDAALAFWGWPLEDDGAALAACRAALDIRLRFERASRTPGDPLANFRCGIGIASGEAVAGRLGSAARFKIDIFGPVVNLASRLEGITKQLRVPILMDGTTAEDVARGGDDGGLRLRRLARLRPFGMDEAVTVSEVLPPVDEPGTLSEEDVARYGAALDAFLEGRWNDAYTELHRVPPWDQGKDFLLSHILRNQRRAPAGWDGVIEMTSK